MMFPDGNTGVCLTMDFEYLGNYLQLAGCDKHNSKICFSQTGYTQNQLAKIAITLEPYKVA